MTTETLNQFMMPTVKTESALAGKNAEVRRTWNGGAIFGLRREAKRHAALGRHDRTRKAVSPLRSATAVHIVASLLLCVLALIPSALCAATNDLSATLQRGLFEEEGNRDLDAAIAAYQSLATQFDKSRQVAATAIFRLGECYRKLGRTNEAVAQYDRIVREFSDQQTLATLSRQNMTGLHQSPAVGDVPAPVGPANASEETTRLAEQLKGIEQLKDNLDEQARAVLAFFPDETLKKMLLQLPKLKEQETIVRENPTLPYGKLSEKLAEKIGFSRTANGGSFHTAYGPDGLEEERHGTNLITDAHWELTKQLSWIKERVDFTVGIQEARLQVLQAAAAKTPTRETVTGETSALSTDDDEKEIRRIQTMIQNSPDLINAPGGGVNGDLTPLSSAASQGQLRAARYLLDHGADVNLRVNGTPLHSAVLKGNKAMVELLLSRGANINARDNGGETPLHTAVRSGFRAVAETLLDHRADVNARNNDRNGQETPLHLAATRANVSMIQLLTAKGADVNAETLNGRTPLSLAAYDGNSADAVKTLLDAKANPNAGKLDAPLLGAIQKRNVEVAELLLKAGANPNAICENDWNEGLFERAFLNPGSGKRTSATPLWLAARNNQLALVRLLLQFKADPNDTQTDGQAILFQALQNPDILVALLDAGGNVEARAFSSNLPLLTAASWGSSPNPAVVELLLKRGANPNATDERGRTPLHYVAEGSGDRKVVELLIANRADPNARDNNGQTPLDVAKEKSSANPYGVAPGTGRVPGLSRIPTRSSPQQPAVSELADLLRTHGALDDLPKMDCIQVSRPSAKFSQTIFQKGTNHWNHFTLLELIAVEYGALSSAIGYPSRVEFRKSDSMLMRNMFNDSGLPFPDFAHVVIRRPAANGKDWREIKINFTDVAEAGDCSKDVPLQWGDVVEVPEMDHPVSTQWSGLSNQMLFSLKKCLTRTVQITVKGETRSFSFGPDMNVQDGLVLSGMSNRQLYLTPVLNGSQRLLASSDLSHVKVIRRDSTGKAHEQIVDCRNLLNPADLWLRDSDVIEVPEK